MLEFAPAVLAVTATVVTVSLGMEMMLDVARSSPVRERVSGLFHRTLASWS